MPKGVYIRTEEIKNKMRESKKDQHGSMYGKHHSKESKNKISQGNINCWVNRPRKRPETSKENNCNWSGGKPKCLDCGKQLTNYSAIRCRKCFATAEKGINNPNWKGGTTSEHKKIRNSLDFKNWRNKIFEKDDYTCQKTKIKGGKLHPHHIKNFSQYPRLRFNIDNGITLSEECHKKFHHIYGIKNNTKEQLEEFLNNK